MKPQVPDELISAYFDGEASPDERAEIERLLTGNDDARRELNETAQLSALLHSFPRETAPIELAANVLRQTNQIPLPPSLSKMATSKALAQNVWRDWKAGFAGAAITAAAMCLMLVLNTRHAGERGEVLVDGRPDLEMASVPVLTDAAKPADADVATADHAMLWRDAAAKAVSDEDVNRQKDVIADAKQAAPAPAPIASAPGRRARSELDHTGLPALSVATTDATSASRSLQAAPADGGTMGLNELGQSNDEFVKGLREGKVYILAPQPADPDSNVAVVYFEVVDINRSAAKLEILLKKNSIEPRSVNNDAPPMPDDLVMMYVVAPGDQLAKTLKDVDQHRDVISNWTAQAPLQLAATGQEVASAVEQKTPAAGGAPVDKSKKAEEPKPSSDGETDLPEVQRVVEAYSQRNGFANTSISNSISNFNGQFGGGRGGLENQRQQQFASSAVEKKAELNQRSRISAVDRPQSNQLTRSEPGYDYIRLNNSLAMNNGINSGQSNTTTFNPVRTEQGRSQVLPGNSRKVAANDANSRALRMLFVLHPQSVGAQGPASPSPARGQ